MKMSYVALETKCKLLIDTGNYIIKSLFIFGIGLVVIRESNAGIQRIWVTQKEKIRKVKMQSRNTFKSHDNIQKDVKITTL